MKAVFVAAVGFFLATQPAEADYTIRMPLERLLEVIEINNARVVLGRLYLELRASGNTPAYFAFDCDLGPISEPPSLPIAEAWCEPVGQLAEVDMSRFVAMWEAEDCMLGERNAPRVLQEIGVNNDVGGFMAHSLVEQGLAEIDINAQAYRLLTPPCR